MQCAMLFLVGIGLFALGTLYFGWKHPKWYVKLYAVICFFWEIFYFLACTLGAWGDIFGIAFALVLLAGITLPLISLWYLMHIHGFSYEKYRREPLRSEQAKVPRKTVGVLWDASRESEDQLKELKEQLGRGVITHEEYEQKKKKLLEKSET